MTAQGPHDMDLCTILFTAVAYVVSDLHFILPRDVILPREGEIASAVEATHPAYLVMMLAGLAALLAKGV